MTSRFTARPGGYPDIISSTILREWKGFSYEESGGVLMGTSMGNSLPCRTLRYMYLLQPGKYLLTYWF
jgi:hypothetical protein